MVEAGRYGAVVDIPDLAAALAEHPATTGLDLLLIHGSRARGDGRPTSDWDLAYLGDTDPATLTAAVSQTVKTDAVDVVDLDRAGALLRFRAARDGIALIERRPEAFLQFRLEAVSFWCDAGPVIRAAQNDVLASLG
jgi:predicted nucleotidyltransferase